MNRNESREIRRHVFAVALLAAVPYLGSLGGDFVYDDIAVIRENPAVMGPDASLWRALRDPYPFDRLYRPVTVASYRLNVLLDGAPFSFHAVNVSLHAVVTCLVCVLAARVLLSRGAAFVAAALFAVHPVHAEAVANIAGRAELLAALFSLSCILLLTRPSGSGTSNWPAREVGGVCALALAVCSKEGALVVPVVVAALWALPRLRPPLLRQCVSASMGFAAVVLGFFALRLMLVGSITPARAAYLGNPLAYVPAADRVRTALVIAWQYLGLLFVPAKLAPDYSPEQIPVVTSWFEPELLLALAVFGAAGWGLARMRRVAPHLLAASAFFFAPLALTGNFLFAIGTNKAERLLYFPSIACCLFAAWVLARPGAGTWALRVAAALLVLGFAARTAVRSNEWRSSLALWGAAVNVVPRSARAHYNYARALSEAGRNAEAITHLKTAWVILPRHDETLVLLGRIHRAAGRVELARRLFTRALAINPDGHEARRELAELPPKEPRE